MTVLDTQTLELLADLSELSLDNAEEYNSVQQLLNKVRVYYCKPQALALILKEIVNAKHSN